VRGVEETWRKMPEEGGGMSEIHRLTPGGQLKFPAAPSAPARDMTCKCLVHHAGIVHPSMETSSSPGTENGLGSSWSEPSRKSQGNLKPIQRPFRVV
jgi:hypothetical protein